MKRLLAILLTLVLMLSMGALAFAEEENYTDEATVTVTKSYKLIGAGTSPAETFTLMQVGHGVVQTGEADAAPALGTITGAVFAAGAATAEGATQNFTITLPEYTSVGVYEYTLRETAGNTAGVAYYANDIKLVVTVINDATGKLRIAGVHTEAAGADGTYAPATKSDTFENTYSAGTLKVSKTVEGILGDKDKYFEFTVTLTGESGKTYGESYAVTGGSYATNPTAIVIGTPATFYLKDGETISIANLPYGVTYTVEEKDYSGEGYTTTANDTEDRNVNDTISDATQTAAFTNTKGGTVDTGVFLDSLPYIIILALVVAAGVVLVLKRRSTDR